MTYSQITVEEFFYLILINTKNPFSDSYYLEKSLDIKWKLKVNLKIKIKIT